MKWSFVAEFVLDCIRKMVDSSEFVGEHRMTEKDFTRKRKLSFAQLSVIILKGAKRGLHTAVKEAVESIHFDLDSYTEAALSKARRKINYTAFKELFQATATSFYQAATQIKRFREMRVWAIDGSKVNLPTNPETLEEFGSEPFKHGLRSQGLCSCLFDTLNSVIFDATLERFDANERELASSHIEALHRYCVAVGTDPKQELITLDRGYPSTELLTQILSCGFRFVVRVNKDNFWREVRLAEGTDTDICRDNLTLRAVRVKLAEPEQTPSGKVEKFATLLTNLPREEFSSSDISKLYRLRWKIETEYGFLKSRVELENFTGLSPLCLRQDFYAALFLSNLIACMKYDAAPLVDEYSQGKKYTYKINYTEAYRELRNSIFDLLLSDSAHDFQRASRHLRKKIAANLIPVRNDRHPKRGKSRSYPRFFHNHKPS